eukprot:gene3718-4238_t
MALRWQSLPACFLLVLASIHLVHSVIYVNQPGYYTYKQKQKTSQYNTFEIQFKTIDATGMLLYAKSVEKNDYLTIELVRGKIRYAAEFGNGVINIDKQITGYHQMYVGQDLADNQWHSVKVTQNVQDITIIIDGKREPKWFGFRRAPPAPTDFSVEEVFIGGLYSYVGVSEEESVSQEGTAACFRSATMNGIDLLQGTAARVNVLSYCPTVNYYPVFFPSRVSHMGVKDYISPRLKLKFDFRTVVSEQVVANYTNSFMKVLRLTVNREGRLVLGVTVENSGSHLVMKTAKQKFHDGKWHSVEFFISNNPPDYEAEFTVDGVKRRSKLKNKYIFDKGPLHFGHGFTGCMKNLVLNDRVVDYTKLQKVAVMLGKCNLNDYCTPNPCINGGKCNQTDTNFRCDCRHTPYTGSCCSQARFNYTCREIHEKIGDRFQSDKYWLDMDGIGGLPPIRAFCRKGNRVIDTVTQVNTTIPYDINAINPTGKKIIPVTYLADEESIRELLLHHSGCRQFIRYRCERSALFKSPIGPKMVQWMGFDDKLHYYWGGSGGRRGYCACGITRTCRNPYQTCNCDSYNRNLHVEDRGYLNIKAHLPVRRIDYFDVQSDSGKTAISTIGPLQCWGDGGKYLAATFRQPYSFLQIGLTYHNDWNNYIDAGDVAFEFLTTRAAGTMVFAKGPFSGDFLDIRLIGRTRARATMNLGYYKNLHLDVDISSKQRTFDDNKPHKLRLDWNRREMNFTVDNITRIVEFHYQYGVTHLDIDGTPFYVGGRNDGLGEGFMGCIRSFYYGGKLVDLPLETEGLSSIGVYPGQGAICKLVNSPCNQGFCIDEYSHYKCNCSVSAFSGAHCQLNELGFTFLSGDWIEHTFQNPVDVQEGYINVAFNTSLSNALIFQMRGKDNAHMTLMLQNGALKLSFNFVSGNLDKQLLITLRHPKPLGKFNDKVGHIVRVHHKENQIFAHVLDDVNVPINYTLNISAPYTLMPFPAPQKLSIGKRDTTIMSLALPQVFEGCVTGLKYHYLPVKARVGVTVDMLGLYNASLTTSSLWTKGSNRAPRKGSCGWELPVPPPLPTIVPPLQFRFKNPVVTVAPTGSSYSFSKVAIVIVICVLAIAAVILLFFTIRCVEKKNKHFKGKVKKLERDYHAQGLGRSKSEQTAPLVRNERQQKQPVSVSSDERQFTTGYQPPAASYQPAAATYQPADSGYQRDGTSYDTKAPVSSSAARQPAAVAASPKDEEEGGDWFL